MSNQSLRQISPDNYSNAAEEKLSLRSADGRKRLGSESSASGTASSCCVIRNQAVLTWLTRFVFLLLTLANTGVIAASVMLMQDCRDHLSPLKTLVPQSASFCINLGMPALFACCITVFTVFGLGCTGRRLTGYALIVISSVEILQGVTTLTFYQCHRMSRHEVLETINTSLVTCKLDTQILWPQQSLIKRSASSSSSSSSSSQEGSANSNFILPPQDLLKNVINSKRGRLLQERRVNRTSATGYGAVRALDINNNKEALPGYTVHGKNLANNENVMNYILKAEQEDIGLATKTSTNQGLPNANILSGSQAERLDQETSPGEVDDVCTQSRDKFAQIAKRSSRVTVSNCIDVCQSYRAVCSAGRPRAGSAGGAETMTLTRDDLLQGDQASLAGTHRREIRPPSSSHTATAYGFGGIQSDTEPGVFGVEGGLGGRESADVSKSWTQQQRTLGGDDELFPSTLAMGECEETIHNRVSHLCHYDNNIIIPLSVCAPLFNILMSICFIYLADCDRKLKEALGDNGIFIKLPAGDTRSRCTRWFLWPCAALCRKNGGNGDEEDLEYGSDCKRCGQKLVSRCCPKGEATSALLCCCLPSRPHQSSSQQYLTAYSTSSEERLQLKPLPSLDRASLKSEHSAHTLIPEESHIVSALQK